MVASAQHLLFHFLWQNNMTKPTFTDAMFDAVPTGTRSVVIMSLAAVLLLSVMVAVKLSGLLVAVDRILVAAPNSLLPLSFFF